MFIAAVMMYSKRGQLLCKCARTDAHWKQTLAPEVGAVQEVGAKAPARLHSVAVDGTVQEAWQVHQRLMRVAVHGPA